MTVPPLLYIHSSTVGTERANSVHAVAMVKAMTEFSDRVTLIAPEIKPHARNALEGLGVTCIAAQREAPSWVPKRLSLVWSAWYTLWRSDSDTRAVTRYLPLLLLDVIHRTRHIVYDLHMPPFEQGRFIHFAFRLFTWCRPDVVSSRIVVISDALARLVQQTYGIASVKVCHDAAEDFALLSLEEREERAPMTEKTIGFAGSLTEGKGFNLIIQLAKAMPALRFIVAGKFSEQTLASIPSNMELRGFLSREQIAEFYEECSITLVPNQKQMTTYGNTTSIGLYNSPLKLFEGMSAETAIIASSIPNLREVLDEKTAIFCDHAELQDWICALKEVVENREIRHELAKRSRKIFLKQYTWQIRVTKMLDIDRKEQTIPAIL